MATLEAITALRINPRLGGFARNMRKEPTPFEQALWPQLRASRLAGLKFRRQTVIGSTIVDFCPAIGLVIEVDGDTHEAVADAVRDARLAERGFTVLRFANAEIGRNMTGVLEAIMLTAGNCPACFTHPPAPSLEREGA